MSETTKKFILLSVTLILLVAVAAAYFFNNKDASDSSSAEEIVGEAMDTADDFYTAWQTAKSEGTTDALVANLANDTRVSSSVQNYIHNAMQNAESTLDPVLCQESMLERFGFKISYEQERSAQYLVLPRGLETKSPNIAVVDVAVIDNAWQITNIACSSGESAPEREFSFEREGFLLKSVPPPLNPEYWHLVFEQNGQMGHTVPLFIGSESVCIRSDGTGALCDVAQFTEATKVMVQGEMTEAGVDVKRINVTAI